MRYAASSGPGSWMAGPRDFAKIHELKAARVALNAVVFADEDVVDVVYVVGGKEGAGG